MEARLSRTRKSVQVALFSAIIVLLAYTPYLGYIPLGVTRATTIHIPVIIGSILLGPASGGFLGFVFGLTSLIANTVTPTVTSFVFSPFYTLGGINGGFFSILICFLPRILTGVVPYYVYKLLKKIKWKDTVSLVISGILGSMTNTILVMNMIFIFFKDQYAAAKNIPVNTLYNVILSIIGINGVPEAIVAGIVATVIVKAVKKGRSI